MEWNGIGIGMENFEISNFWNRMDQNSFPQFGMVFGSRGHFRDVSMF